MVKPWQAALLKDGKITQYLIGQHDQNLIKELLKKTNLPGDTESLDVCGQKHKYQDAQK